MTHCIYLSVLLSGIFENFEAVIIDYLNDYVTYLLILQYDFTCQWGISLLVIWPNK